MINTPGIEPTPSGTKPPCTSNILRYRCGEITVIAPTTLYRIFYIAGVSGPALSSHQEQRLFMGWPAPSPPRSATGRDDEEHCGAGPPCTFRYACTLYFALRQKKLDILGAPGRSAVPSPPRGSNHPMCNGRVVHDRLYYAGYPT